MTRKQKRPIGGSKQTRRAGSQPTPGTPDQSAESSWGERLQKVLAAAGWGSRRKCEELIVAGRVEVDGRPAELGMRVDPTTQDIRVDGVRLKLPRKLYYALNKPAGVVCTHRDPARRTRVIDLVEAPSRVFPIGRLDRSSEGLILLTNDGEFANLLAHPRFAVEKTYRVLVAGQPSREVLDKLVRGVHLAEGIARVRSVRVRKTHKLSTELEIVLAEGKNREIRRVLAKVGHKVMKLRRIAIGPVRLGKLPVGAYRPLTTQEVAALRAAAQQVRRTGGGPTHRPSSRAKPPQPIAKKQAGTEPASTLPPRQGTVIPFDTDEQ